MRRLIFLPVLVLAGCGLFGKPTLDFDQLRGDLTEAQAMELQPKADWQCNADDANRGVFGQRYCDGLVETLNELPATRIDYLFRDGTLSFAIIEFKPGGFDALAKQLDAKHERVQGGSPRALARLIRENVTTWKVADGVIASSPTATKPNGNVFLMWASGKELKRAGG